MVRNSDAGKSTKMGGPRSIMAEMQFLAIDLLFRSRRAKLPYGIGTSNHVDFIGVNGLAVRLQQLHFMKPLFVKVQKF